MKTNRISYRRTPARYQTGVTLMETMISLALSLLVTSAMVALMANSMGTATRIIHSTQLSDELRNAMSMITRDVRRANYSAYSIYCYGNSDCGYAGGVAEQAGDVTLAPVNGYACFTFTLDRGHDGNAANDAVAGFRLRPAEDDAPVYWLEMFTGDSDATPDCTADDGQDGWIALTDPDTVNITRFTVDDSGSFTKEFLESDGVTFNNRQRQLQIGIAGRLVYDEDRNLPDDAMVSREIEDIIYVRNDYIL